MRFGLGLTLAGVLVAATLAGCGWGEAPPTPASLQAQPSVAATLTWAQRDCGAATVAMNDVAGPLERHDAAGVVTAGRLAKVNESIIGQSEASEGGIVTTDPEVVEYSGAVLAEIVAIADNAAAYERGGTLWSVVTAGEATLAGTFKSMESVCWAAGVTIGSSASQPAVTSAPRTAASTAPTPTPSFTLALSTGCPTSAQLLAAWDAALASTRKSWGSGVTGFMDTQCWGQWVVSQVIADGNGSVIFTRAGGRIALFPETELAQFDAAICGVPRIRAIWASPTMGPGSCS